jgi:chemotaxis protein CheC
MDLDNISDKDLDIFKEIGSIGSGNAATALSNMINKKVTITPVKTVILPIEDVPEELGGSEIIVFAVYLKITGGLNGDAIFLYPEEIGMKLIKEITNKGHAVLNEEAISAYKEMSNIFTGSYLNALSSLLNIVIIPSVPYFARDMLGALIDAILAEIGAKVESILLIKTDIMIEDKVIGGGYMMIFDPDSLNKLKQLIMEKYGF